jgi:hypothetical protein
MQMLRLVSSLRRTIRAPCVVKPVAAFCPAVRAIGGSVREYKVNAGDVRIGHIVEVDGKLYQITGLHHTQAAMRKSSMAVCSLTSSVLLSRRLTHSVHGRFAFVQFEMKDMKTGSKVPLRVKPSDKIERNSNNPPPLPLLHLSPFPPIPLPFFSSPVLPSKLVWQPSVFLFAELM